MCTYIHVLYIYEHMYINIYREKEREKDMNQLITNYSK